MDDALCTPVCRLCTPVCRLCTPVCRLCTPVCRLCTPVCRLCTPVCRLCTPVCRLCTPVCRLCTPVCRLCTPVCRLYRRVGVSYTRSDPYLSPPTSVPQLTLSATRHSARYFLSTLSLAWSSLRERWMRCLKGLASTTFSSAEPRSLENMASWR